jgi:transposase
MNNKVHAVADANGRPLSFFMTAGPVSDYTGAAALLDDLPKAQWLLADRGYDADWFRDALHAKGIKPCIPGRRSRNAAVKHDKRRYRLRNHIEIMFGRLKDWRRVATWLTTVAQPSSSRQLHSLSLSSSGYDQWILSLVANYLRGVEQLDQLIRDGKPSTLDVARAVRDLVLKVIVHPPGEDGRPEIEVQGYLSELINPTLGQKMKCRGDCW